MPTGLALQAANVLAMTDLGTLGGEFSEALAINPRGHIVGSRRSSVRTYSTGLCTTSVVPRLGTSFALASRSIS